jgi:hypothetical protein
MPATSGPEVKQALKGGAAAGAIGGALLSVFMTVMAAVKGLDVWSMVFKGAAAPFLGERAMQPGFDGPAVLLGIVCHFAVSIGWGLLFGLVAYGFSRPVTMLLGALWGIVVWLGMYYVVLPLVGLGEMVRTANTSTTIIAPILFGISVGAAFVPFQQRKVVAQPRRPAEVPG